MPALSQQHSGGGDGSDFTAREGKQPGVLAEVVDTGMRVNSQYGGKAKPTCKGIFILPEDLVGDDAPAGLAGQPKFIYFWVNNNAFTNSDDPDYRTAYEKALAAWAGRTIPLERQKGFLFGRELGKGKDAWGNERWDTSLEGDAMKGQLLAKPGIPVGSPVLLNIVHSVKDGKTHANPGPCSMMSMDKWCQENGKSPSDYAAFCSTWKPGLNRADDNARRYSLNDALELLCDGEPFPAAKPYTYRSEAEREADKASTASGSNPGGQDQAGQGQVGKRFDEPEDVIPF